MTALMGVAGVSLIAPTTSNPRPATSRSPSQRTTDPLPPAKSVRVSFNPARSARRRGCLEASGFVIPGPIPTSGAPDAGGHRKPRPIGWIGPRGLALLSDLVADLVGAGHDLLRVEGGHLPVPHHHPPTHQHRPGVAPLDAINHVRV